MFEMRAERSMVSLCGEEDIFKSNAVHYEERLDIIGEVEDGVTSNAVLQHCARTTPVKTSIDVLEVSEHVESYGRWDDKLDHAELLRRFPEVETLPPLTGPS